MQLALLTVLTAAATFVASSPIAGASFNNAGVVRRGIDYSYFTAEELAETSKLTKSF